ncbi:pyrroloquinoline quinone precursor peptide PqqA [Streptomyces spinosirectus]
MNETLPCAPQAERSLQEQDQTSDEKVWQTPGHTVVETALEVTAYALGDR